MSLIIVLCVSSNSFEINHILPKTGDLYPIIQAQKWGYIDGNGTVVIPPTFADAHSFSGEVACVAPSSFFHSLWPQIAGLQYKLIDRNGMLSKKSFQFLSEFQEGVQPAREVNNFSVLTWITPTYGYIGPQGNWLIEPQFLHARNFSEGLAAVQMAGNLNGFINHVGKVVIENPDFVEIDDFSNGLAWFLDKETAKWGAIDPEGIVVINPAYSSKPSPFVDGVAAVPTGVHTWGVLDKNSGQIIADGFDYVWCFSEGRARVMQERMEGFIDKQGNLIIPPKYSFARDYAEGLAAVHNDKAFGYIDLEGTVAIPFVFRRAESFRNGLARVNERSENKMTGEFDYVDRTGNMVYFSDRFE